MTAIQGCLLAWCAATLAATAPRLPEFSTATKLSASCSLRPLARIDNAGRLYVVWGDQGKLWIRDSADKGVTWSPPRAIQQRGVSRFSMTVDKAAGTVFAVWEKDAAVFAARSADSGRRWTSPLSLSKPTEVAARNPGIFVDPAGSVFAAYLGNSPQGGAPYTVVILKSADRGVTFKESGRIAWSTYFTGENSPQFDVDRTGSLYLVFPSDLNTRYATNYLTISKNGGHDWSPPSQLSLLLPSMAVDDRDALNIVGANMYIPYMYKLTFQRTAGKARPTTSHHWENVGYTSSHVAVNRFGAIDVVWANHFTRSVDRGATWSPATDYTDDAKAEWPSMVEDSAGKIHIVWSSPDRGVWATASQGGPASPGASRAINATIHRTGRKGDRSMFSDNAVRAIDAN